MKGDVSTQNALQKSKTETRELLGGTTSNNILSDEGVNDGKSMNFRMRANRMKICLRADLMKTSVKETEPSSKSTKLLSLGTPILQEPN